MASPRTAIQSSEPVASEERAQPLALAAPTAARSARLTAKLYLPTALTARQLPAGLADVRTVPRLQPPNEHMVSNCGTICHVDVLGNRL